MIVLDYSGDLFPLSSAHDWCRNTSACAAAVSHAGGLGSLGIGSSTVIQACTLIKETRMLTDQSFNGLTFLLSF